MLVKFRSPRAAEFVMFGDVAVQLIKMMGCSGNVPGAIKAEDIPAALALLSAAAAKEGSMPAANARPTADDEDPGVSLRQRALPLVQMLEAALADDAYVMWEQ
jgi:hypothetical protein